MMRVRRSPPRRGIVLLAVLVVVVLLSLAAYQYSELMTAEHRAADSHARSMQARAAADSGIHYAAALLSNADAMTTLNGNPWDNAAYFQDVAVGSDSDARRQTRCSLVALRDADDPAIGSQPFRYGVIDEAGKINLNALLKLDSTGDAGKALLMKLPNMTEDIANAILDWMDPDDTPRQNGAENEYYSTLNPPYRTKNGPLDSLEELLLVKGVTPQLLFGNDRNRNGVLDPDENDGSAQVDLGWSAYLTVYSREANVDNQGNPRIYLNDADLDALSDKLNTALGTDLAQFIIAYRLYGGTSSGGSGGGSGQAGAAGGASGASGQSSRPSGNGAGSGAAAGGSSPQSRRPTGGGAGGGAAGGGAAGGGAAGGGAAGGGAAGGGAAGGGAAGGGGTGGGSSSRSGGGGAAMSQSDIGAVRGQVSADRASRGSRKLTKVSSIFDLLTAQVSVPVGTGQNQRTVTYKSPLSDPGQQHDLLPKLLDSTTTTLAGDLTPRVNVNTAARAVLAALPGLTDTDVQTILDKRPQLTATTAPDAIYETPAWLLTDANLSPSVLKSLENYVTARTQIYRVQSLGYAVGGGPTARIEAVIDTNQGRPRVLYWRDLSELGKGFDVGQSNSR